MTYDLFVFAGESSGDAHGAAIMKQLKTLYPEIHVTGVAGPKMREIGLDLFMPMENFMVMGYSDVFKNILKIAKYFKQIQNYILKSKPKAVLFIDYPGFNLRMAKALRKRNFPNKLIHYICPTVWAHGKKRVYTLAQTLDLLLSIFPFEAQYFKETQLKPTYVGHPLIEQTFHHRKKDQWKAEFSIPQEMPLIGIFPGSRSSEIKLNFPKILASCEIFKKKYPEYGFVISVVNEKFKPLMEELIKASSLVLEKDIFALPSNENLQIMSHIQSSIATSGTINFELAIMNVPTVVVYHLTKVNAWIIKNIVKLNLPYYCIVNIITKKHIFPELYYLDFIPHKVADTLDRISQDSYLRTNSLEGCKEMLSIMGSQTIPSEKAAQEIGALIYG
jgi:lipid-A-disaccharide synthase